MTDERLRHLYMAGTEARRARDDARGCDLPPDVLLALARGELPEDERPTLIDRVLADARCREEFALLRALVVAERSEGLATGAGGAVSADAPPADPFVRPLHGTRTSLVGRRRAWVRFGAPLAAAAALVLAIGVSGKLRDDDAPVMRGGGDGVVLVAPAAQVSRTDSLAFAWRTVPGAERYTFELLDAEGALLYDTVTADTALALPPTVALESDTEYRWLVRAADAGGGDRGSAVARLRVGVE